MHNNTTKGHKTGFQMPFGRYQTQIVLKCLAPQSPLAAALQIVFTVPGSLLWKHPLVKKNVPANSQRTLVSVWYITWVWPVALVSFIRAGYVQLRDFENQQQQHQPFGWNKTAAIKLRHGGTLHPFRCLPHPPSPIPRKWTTVKDILS